MKKFISVLLVLCMALSLCACGPTKAENKASTATDIASPTEEIKTEEEFKTSEEVKDEVNAETPAVEVDSELPVNVMVLNGTTGFGMAKLINDSNNGSSALNYIFSVETDASNITAALVNGTVDIAALPTNAASTIYNKTQGGVQILALNTLGVLYLVTNSENETITSMEDLRGKTVYAPAQNPSFIFSYICQENGLVPGTDITIDNTYAQPADLRTAVAAGEVDIAVLPEPMVTMARSSNDKLTVSLDLTEQWDAIAPVGSLVQGCVVVRAEFAAEHPNEIAKFLEEYESSIAYLSEDVEGAAAMIESTGVFAKAAVAQKAIPNCNVCFITGEDMKAAMSEFVNIMFAVAPASVGNAVPGDDFYYIP